MAYRRQAIIVNAGMLLIRILGTNFDETLGEIHTFSFKKIHLNMLCWKWRPFGLGLNVLSARHKMAALIPNTNHITRLKDFVSIRENEIPWKLVWGAGLMSWKTHMT